MPIQTTHKTTGPCAVLEKGSDQPQRQSQEVGIPELLFLRKIFFILSLSLVLDESSVILPG